MNICEFKSGDIVSIGLKSNGLFEFGDLNSFSKKINATVFINHNFNPISFVAFRANPDGINDLHCHPITEAEREKYNIPADFNFGTTLARTIQAEMSSKLTIIDFANGDEIELALNREKRPIWGNQAQEADVVSWVKAKIYKLPSKTGSSISYLAFTPDVKENICVGWYENIPSHIRETYNIDRKYQGFSSIANGVLARPYILSTIKTKDRSKNKSSSTALPIMFLLGAVSVSASLINKNNVLSNNSTKEEN
jgi:hypothetical protein